MKRFWKSVSVAEGDEGWRVLLDDRPVRTPAKRHCEVPVPAMAEAIAREWDEQQDQINPLQMPMTRAAAV